ncbi:MAG: efflux RND transporter periplasmic adaptor subunit, partial [Balneolaceae bacterium]
MKKTILFALSLFLWSCSGETETGDSSSTSISVTSAEVQTRNLSETFSVSSEVVAYRRSYVASRISGLVEEVRYEEGQYVNRGDILAQMDVRQQQIDLRRANAALEETRDVYERNQVLLETNSISRAEYLSSRRALDQAQSDVDQLELQIEFGTVRAPINGVVTARLIEPGNNVSVNERMFTLTDMNLLVVRPGVSEMNVSGLEEG